MMALPSTTKACKRKPQWWIRREIRHLMSNGDCFPKASEALFGHAGTKMTAFSSLKILDCIKQWINNKIPELSALGKFWLQATSLNWEDVSSLSERTYNIYIQHLLSLVLTRAVAKVCILFVNTFMCTSLKSIFFLSRVHFVLECINSFACKSYRPLF